MSGKITRAEKCDEHFQEVLERYIAKGMDPRAALRETRRVLANQTPPPQR